MFRPCELNIVSQKIGGGASYPPMPAAFNPSLIPGFVVSFTPSASRSASKLWQDAAKTIAASASNDPVRVLQCPWSGIEFTSPSDAARGLLKTGGGKWWIETDGVDDVYDSISTNFPGLLPSASTVLVAIRTGSKAEFSSFSTVDGGGSTLQYDRFTDGNSYVSVLRSSRLNSQIGVAQNSDIRIAYQSDASSYTRSFNGVQNISTTGAYAAGGRWSVANSINSGSYLSATAFDGRIYGIVAYSRILTASELATIDTYLQGLYS